MTTSSGTCTTDSPVSVYSIDARFVSSVCSSNDSSELFKFDKEVIFSNCNGLSRSTISSNGICKGIPL